MYNTSDDHLVDLGEIRLERAITRLRQQDYAGALDDLRAALVHMHGSGADPEQVEHLAAVIDSVEGQVAA